VKKRYASKKVQSNHPFIKIVKFNSEVNLYPQSAFNTIYPEKKVSLVEKMLPDLEENIFTNDDDVLTPFNEVNPMNSEVHNRKSEDLEESAFKTYVENCSAKGILPIKRI
jgi:hypothetical protein